MARGVAALAPVVARGSVAVARGAGKILLKGGEIISDERFHEGLSKAAELLDKAYPNFSASTLMKSEAMQATENHEPGIYRAC